MICHSELAELIIRITMQSTVRWSDVEIRSDVFLEILRSSFLVLSPGDEAALTIFTVGPGAASPPCITQAILGREDTEGRLERSHGLEVCTHTIGKTGEHGITTSDVDILWRRRERKNNNINLTPTMSHNSTQTSNIKFYYAYSPQYCGCF